MWRLLIVILHAAQFEQSGRRSVRSAKHHEDVRVSLREREQIGDDLLDAVVVTTGTEAYRRPDGIAVVPAGLLGQ